MRVVLRYFREHRWQRRVVTLSLAAIIGVLVAWVALPIIEGRRILSMLGDDDRVRRNEGIFRAEMLARRRPQLLDMLEDHLGDSDDSRFSAIMEVLARTGRFDSPRRTDVHRDRWIALNFRAAPDPDQRLMWLADAILSGRDNAHVRRVLTGAGADKSPGVRGESALLAARLGDDHALASLLGDSDPNVRARAATSAALAKRAGHADAIAPLLSADRTDAERAAGAFALTRLDAKTYGPSVLAAAEQAVAAGNDDLLEKLLIVLSDPPNLPAKGLVGKVIGQYTREGKLPPASAFVAARKLGVTEALPAAEAAIDRLIAGKDEMTVGQAMILAAAVRAADGLGAGPALFRRTLKELWHPGPGVSLAMVYSAEALGRRADAAKDPAVQYLLSKAAHDGRAPLAAASAAAAVAMLRLHPEAPQTMDALWAASASEAYLGGDYIVWHVGRNLPRNSAASAAAAMSGPYVYDKAVRSVGAMLVGMIARDTRRADDANRFLRDRLHGGIYGPETDPFVAGAYKCALMFLGRGGFDKDVSELAYADNFPKRRALTALMMRRVALGFDMVLPGRRTDPAQIDSFLSGRLMARVYRALEPQLTRVDMDAPASVRYWQCDLLRDDYLIHRSAILAQSPTMSP